MKHRKRKTTKRQRQRQFQTIRALASELSAARSTLHRWMGRPDWPFGKGPWSQADLASIKAWIAATVTNDGPAELREARAGLLVEQIRLLDLENEISAGRWLNKSDYQKAVIGATTRFRTGLQRIGGDVADEVTGRDAGTIARLIEGKLKTLRDDYAKEMRQAITSSIADPRADEADAEGQASGVDEPEDSAPVRPDSANAA